MAQESNLEEIVVTGSRVVTDGTATPTPVTVVSMEQLQATSPVNLADSLNLLPTFAGSLSPTTAGSSSSGGNFLNLRGVGSTRTLILVDGRRFTPATSTGQVNVDHIPQELVKRVDVVTGGASAAYGSDAVAGVVNFVLDRKLEGLKGQVQTGITRYGDKKTIAISMAAGGSFHEGRGHLVVSGEYVNDSGVPVDIMGQDPKKSPRDWIRNFQSLVANPAYTATNGQPQLILVPNSRQSHLALGSVVSRGALRGVTFNPDGSVRGTPYDFGQYATPAGAIASGGEGWNASPLISISSQQKRWLGFAGVTYDVTDKITAWADFTAAYDHAQNDSHVPATNIFTPSGVPISINNPFVGADLRARMQAAGLASIEVNALFPQLGPKIWDSGGDMVRVSAGLDGEFAGWNWSFSAGHGDFTRYANTLNQLNAVAFLEAVDVVTSPTTGQPICRSQLTAPNNGCTPINILGYRDFTPEQRARIMGDALYPQRGQEDVVELSVRGQPFSTWAGPVGVGGGFGYRYEFVEQTEASNVPRLINPLTNAQGGWQLTNSLGFKGDFNVKEAFGEVAIPLARDLPFAQAVDVNAAIRYTDYSTSGGVTTWKVGGVYEIIPGLRIRGTKSRDVRAPNVFELFRTGATGYGVIRDPFLNNQSYNVVPIAGGNPNLTPEKADTLTFGVTYRPDFVPGLALSADRYTIRIKDAISTLGSQAIINECFAGNGASFCDLISRGPNGQIFTIQATSLNIAESYQSGEDYEVSYSRDMFGGGVSLRALASRLDKTYTTQLGSVKINRTASGGNAEWRANFLASYTRGPLQVQVVETYISGGTFDVLTMAQRQGSYDDHPGQWITNLSGRYDLMDGNLQIYGTISNLFDKDPPETPGSLGVASTYMGVYNALGMNFTAGVRFKY